MRALEVEVLAVRSSSAPRFRLVRGKRSTLAIATMLPPGGMVEIDIGFIPEIDGVRSSLPKTSRVDTGREPSKSEHSTEVSTGNSTLNLILAQAEADLDSLELPGVRPGHDRQDEPATLIAGVPRYVGVFCRDVLTSAWQASLLSTRYVENTLP